MCTPTRITSMLIPVIPAAAEAVLAVVVVVINLLLKI
jgi:hypothetical protein